MPRKNVVGYGSCDIINLMPPMIVDNINPWWQEYWRRTLTNIHQTQNKGPRDLGGQSLRVTL